MPRIACLMMQKNEEALLQPWLLYHGYLFGFENLYVYDNGSTSAGVEKTLRRFERAGVQVERSAKSPADFEHKGKIFTQKIHDLEENGAYDIVLPLDCDEFVAIMNRDGQHADGGFSCNRRKIHDHLDLLAQEKTIVQTKYCLDNRPGFINLFRLAELVKSIIPLGDFHDVDHGFHNAKARTNPQTRETDLVYVHLHFKPFHALLAHARHKLLPFVDPDDQAALRAFRGVGDHLIKYFFMTADEYYADFGSYAYDVIKFDGFEAMLTALMPMAAFLDDWCDRPAGAHVSGGKLHGRDIIDLDGAFDPVLYLQANQDVAASRMHPVAHYCMFGHRERRPLRPGR